MTEQKINHVSTQPKLANVLYWMSLSLYNNTVALSHKSTFDANIPSEISLFQCLSSHCKKKSIKSGCLFSRE